MCYYSSAFVAPSKKFFPMNFADLHFDTICHVFVMLGNSPHGYIERLRCRRISKFFSRFNVLLFASESGSLKINRYTMDITRFLKQDIPTYDLDDMRWIKTADLRKGNCKSFQITQRVLKNPFTFKLCYWDVKLKHWVQRLKLLDDDARTPTPIKVIIPKIPPNMLGVNDDLPKRRKDSERRPALISSTLMPFFVPSLCKEIITDANRHIVALSLKDSHCSTSEFELLAKALPKTQIVKLNVSSHWCNEELRIGSLFLNAQKIQHLNVNYCGCLSQFDQAAFIYMLLNSNSLRTLKFLFTDVLEDTFLLLKLCGHQSQLNKLAISLPRDPEIFDLEHRRVGQVETLNVTSPVTETILSIDQRSLFFNGWQLSSKERLDLQSFVLASIPELCPEHEPRKKKKKLSLHERYAQRNHYRNQLTKEDRKCRSCGFIWPAGSLKIQTFEGLQSKCKVSNKRCADTSRAANLSVGFLL